MRKHRWRILVYGCLVVVLVGAYNLRRPIRYMVMNRTIGFPPTVASVLNKYSGIVRREFEPVCRQQGIRWPPERLQLLAFKQEKVLEVWGANSNGAFGKLTSFPILGLSGALGPKRKSGDLQVPEGFYRLTNLNPESSFHLSIRVDYPNQEDVVNATVPRERMGGDIYIHGRKASVGCLAMGDPAIEKIFCLVAMANPDERNIMIAPVDFRGGKEVPSEQGQQWIRELYSKISNALTDFMPEPMAIQ